MAVRNIAELRASAPEELKRLNDRDLVEMYSAKSGVPFEQAADFFKIPKSGVFREMGGQLVAGATVDLPRMLGESIDYFTGSTGQGRVSQGLIRGAERREATSQADTRGMGRVGRDVFVAGSRALAPTVATIGLGAAATLAGGPVGGALVAGGSSAVLFGGTGAYQTRQRVLEETGDVQAADDAAIRSGLLQGLGEGIGTYAGLKLLKPVAKAFRGTPTTAGVARRMTDQSVLRPALRATAANIPVQVATEIAQDVGTSLIEQSYGASAEDLGAISYQSGAAALGMSILLGPLAIGGSARRARNNRRVQQALDGDPSVTPEEQAVALRFITQEAERQGVPVEDRDTWVREQLLPQEQRRTETLERMERIREQLAISDPTDSQSQAELIAEFRGLYEAPSGVTETLPDGTSVTLTNGQLMARELNAYRELIAADSQQQRDPEAEIDLTVEDPSAMVPITAEELIDSLLDTSDLDPLVGLGARSGVDLELPSSAGQSLEIDLTSDMLGAGEAVDAQEAPANEFRPTALLPSGEVEATLETTPTIGAEVAPQPSTPAPTQGGIAAQIAAFPAVVRMNERLNEAQSRLDSEVEKLNAIEAVGPQLSRADALRIRNALIQLQPMLERNRKELAAEQKRLEAAQDTVEQADAVRLQNALAQVEQLNQRLNDQRQRISQGLEQVRALNARVDTARVARGFEGAMQLSAEADRAEADRAATPTPDAPTPPRSLRDGIQGMQIGAAPDTVIEFEPGPFAQRSDAELEAIIADDRIPTVQRREAEAELELRQPFSLEGVPTRQRSAQQPARAETGTAQVEATPQVEATLEPSEVIVVNTEAEATPEANAAAKAEDDAVIAALKSAGLLDAEVFDPNAEKTAGPKSLPAQVFAAIRNALLNPGNKGMFSVRKKGLAAIDPEATAKYAPLVERAAAAVKAYGDAYDAINTKISNLVRSADQAPIGYEQIVADMHARIRVEGMTPEVLQDIASIGKRSVEIILTARDTGTPLSQLYKDYDAALAELTEALGGNPKNMDVIVRLVKDRVQNARKGTMEPKKKKRWEKLDARVSRGWNAERRARDAGVKLSPFDVRPTPIRSANEATAGQNPLRLAYDGLDDMGSEQETRGTEGIIAYLQKNGTGYEKLLSRAIGMVYNRMAEAGYEPQIRFVKSARGKYDPAKNTITVGETASPSVLLHEMLHGALQWYVYNNQNSTEVQSLIQAVKDVVDYKGALGEKAEAVRKVLAKLMKDGNELDAVLELVSYGNTLNSFRSALEAMPKKGTPRTFYQAVEDIWIRVLSVVNELLGLQGKSNTLAADVIENTFRLLESAAREQDGAQIESAQKRGRELKSEVSGEIKATPGVDMVRMAKLLGPQLYGNMSDIGKITIKEVFQNSFDALKGAIQQGAQKNGVIEINTEPYERTITIKDNGTGMTPEVINNAFLTLAGTSKETERASGGLGIAKMLFLFGNESLSLTTVRNGVESTLQTSGKELISSFSDPSKAPTIRTRNVTDKSGTTIIIKLPESYVDENGDTQSIEFPYGFEITRQLEESPLLEPITVKANGDVLNIGEFFPIDKYSVLAVAKFPWGRMRVMVRPWTDNKYRSEENVFILSNGLYQFEDKITVDPAKPYSDTVPFKFYLNIEPDVKADDPTYPIALNRKGFTQSALKDYSALKTYLNVLYANKVSKDDADSFGELTQISNNGNTAVPVNLKIPEAEQGSAFEINANDKVELREGRLFINNRQMPEITRESMEKMKRDPGKFRVDQSLLDPEMVIVHDNITLDDKDFVAQAKARVGEAAFNNFVYEVGETFKSLRDVVASVAGSEYASIVDVPVGVSFDTEYYGVNTAVPFKSMMINPLFWRVKTPDTKPERVIMGTMIHEIAHHKERNHSETGFIPEMQRLFMELGMSGDMQILTEDLRRLFEKHDNIIKFFTEVQADAKTRIKPKGQRLQDANAYSAADGVMDDRPDTGGRSLDADRAAESGATRRDGGKLPGVRPPAAASDTDITQSEQSTRTPEADGVEGRLKPLRGLREAIEEGQQQGRELYSTVEDTDIPSQGRIAASSQFAPAMTNEQFKQFNKKVLPQYISSQFMFTAFGGWWGRTMDTLDAKVVSKLSEHIKTNHPKLTNALSWVNNSFGLQGPVAAFLLRAKDDRRGGSIQVTMFADYLATLPVEQSRVVLRSMDARLDALRKGKPLPQVEGVERKIALLANDMLDRYWEFARNERNERLRAQLAGVYNSKTKQWDGGVKFSQGLVDPKSKNALVSPTFGEKAVSKFTAQRTKDEITDDAIMFNVDEKGSPILSGQFIGMYQLSEDYIKARKDGVPMADITPDAFISVERFNNGERPVWNGLPMDFDNAYLWNVQRRGDKGYRMSARLDFASANAARTSQQIAGAIQNTMGILANSYSAARLTDALNDYARGTPSAVVYDSLDELNSVLNGKWEGTKFVPQADQAKWRTQIRNRNLLDARSPEAGASAIKDMTRNTSSWVRVPSGPAYGQMAGKIVQGSLWNTLQDEYDTRPIIDNATANNIMRWFKKAKTQYNPGTWGTNVFTNFTMAMMDDIPMATISTAARLYAGYALPTDVARKMGIVLTEQEQDLMAKIFGTNALIGNFSSNEIKRDVYDALRANLDSKDNKDKSVASRVMQWMGVEKSRLQTLEKRFAGAADKAEKFDKAMTEWYAAQDNVFRVASMLNKLGQMAKDGKELDAEAFRIAGDHSRFAFLDYDISAKGVRLMRQTAFPFISWPYAAAKLIGHVAVHKPWKLVNLYAGYWMLDALTQALSGDDDDELRKAGPRWARDRLLFGMGPHTHLRVPFMGDDENPVYYNLGRYLAPSSFGDRAPNPFMGADWWPTFISPGGPYISGVLMLTAGVDPFTGDKLVPPTASTWEDMAARLKATQSLFTPNIPFVSIPETEKFFDAISDRTDRSDNFGNLYLSRVAGLRFYDFNVQAATQSQARAKRAIKAQYDMEIARVRRSVLRHETPDYDRFMEQRDKLLERYRKEIEELTGEEQN